MLIFREFSGLPEPVIIKPGEFFVWDNGTSVRVAKKTMIKGTLIIKPLAVAGLKAIRHLGNDVPKNLPVAAIHALPSVWLTYRKKSHILAAKGVLTHQDIQFDDKIWF